jgi:FAD/FMN-containing dehydrogenase
MLRVAPGVISHTGVGGFTLGGGFGRLNRKYGLAVDNVTGATIVTADGRVRQISAEAEPDLFWAIRGGGGNFGVVTDFEFQLHPFERNVLSGNIVWPLEQARDVLEFYAEHAAAFSNEMYIGPSLAAVPDLGDALQAKKSWLRCEQSEPPPSMASRCRITRSCRPGTMLLWGTAFAPTPRTAWSKNGHRALSTR